MSIMRELWRRTSELFWQHSILWLPLLCAELCAFCLNRLTGLATKRIYDWFLAGRSLLSNDPFAPPLDRTAVWKATILSLPLRWTTYFVNLCLYTAAFILTAMLVEMALRRQQPDVASSLSALRSYTKRIIIFSLKIYALVAIMSGVMYLPVKYLWPVAISLSSFAGEHLFPLSVTILSWTCIAWVMTPAGFKLLQAPESQWKHAESIRLGRILSILALVVTNAFWYLIQYGEQAIISTANLSPGPQLQIIYAIGSLLRVFPCVLLFIALSLLAERKIQEPVIDANSEDTALP